MLHNLRKEITWNFPPRPGVWAPPVANGGDRPGREAALLRFPALRLAPRCPERPGRIGRGHAFHQELTLITHVLLHWRTGAPLLLLQ